MNIFLDESQCRTLLFPLTRTRHVTDLRLGILTLREKWELLNNGKLVTDKESADLIFPANAIPFAAADDMQGKEMEYFHHPWDLFRMNESEIRKDFDLITRDREKTPVPQGNQVINSDNIFIEEGAKVIFSIINAENGPVYIGKNAEVMEGSMIRGPFSLGENSVVKMGSKIYGGTTVGPNCIVGGEIKNTIIIGHSNKAHDGYLGDSVIGEWCNLGAGTSNSNVKNTGGEVRYVYPDAQHIAGVKAGLIMGDYSRAAINTSFNTGTIIGVCCNIFESRPSKYVPDFSWGNENYNFDKAISDIRNWKKMKGKDMEHEEIEMLKNIYLKN